MAYTIPDDQILEATLTVMAERGYAGATTRAIAAAAAINEVTLFRRFGSKENLLLAAVEREYAQLQAEELSYSGDLEADLRRVVRFYQQLMAKRGRVIAMLLNEMLRQPALLEIMQTPLTIIGNVTALLARYQQEGALQEEPPLRAFAALVGPLFMEAIASYVQPAQAPPPFAVEAHVRHYLGGRMVS